MSLTRDQVIGENLALYRGTISQKDLADKMRSLGWKWSQSTVWSIEKGERSLKLAEAADLEKFLDFRWFLLPKTTESNRVEIGKKALNEAREELREAVKKYYLAQSRLRGLAHFAHLADPDLEADDLADFLSSPAEAEVSIARAELRADRQAGKLLDEAIGLGGDSGQDREKDGLDLALKEALNPFALGTFEENPEPGIQGMRYIPFGDKLIFVHADGAEYSDEEIIEQLKLKILGSGDDGEH